MSARRPALAVVADFQGYSRVVVVGNLTLADRNDVRVVAVVSAGRRLARPTRGVLRSEVSQSLAYRSGISGDVVVKAIKDDPAWK
jgi:hypothetical protein